VFEGFYSEGANKYLWTAPVIDGAYSIAVELFPFKPSGVFSGNFASAITTSATVIVSESNRKINRGFYPDSSYLLLYHFLGDMKNSGYASIEIDSKAADNSIVDGILTGNPSPSFSGSVFGYYFKQNESLKAPLLAVPVSASGAILPFSIKLKFLPDYSYQAAENDAAMDGKDAKQLPFFKIETDDRDFSISIGFSSYSNYYVDIISEQKNFTVESFYAAEKDNGVVNLNISFLPDKNFCDFIWIINGETIVKRKIPFLPKLDLITGKTTIGSGIYPVLYDEAGIYTKNKSNRNSADSYSFFDYNSEKFGDNLVLAEGFDYSNEFSLLKLSSAEVKEGAVYLGRNGWICAGEKIYISGNIEVLIAGECTFVIKDEKGNEVFSREVVNTGNNRKSFIADNIVPGYYSVYLVNNEASTKLVDNIFIAKTFADIAAK
jgi:hypothetical protein